MSIDATPKPFRGPWEGDTKIVVGIDIGTTQSGVAFAFLQNDAMFIGASQVIHRVTRWPGQEARDQQGKIPTLVWYDRSRKATAFGAEAQLPTIEEQAEDNSWVLAKYFKLHLHPSDMQAKHELKLDGKLCKNHNIDSYQPRNPALPPGVTLRQIYSDFLGYLLKHTRSFFEDRILDGKQTWSRYSPTMEVVIAHPNGWGIREQAFLRSAAVAAGLATTDQAPTKVRFVTEAEASVHFCIHHTNLGTVLKVRGSGSGSVATAKRWMNSARYELCGMRRWWLHGRYYAIFGHFNAPSSQTKRGAGLSVQAGAIFVDFEVEKHLRKTLTNAGLSSEDVVEYTKAGVKDFEGFAKRAFRDETTDQSIAVAHTRFNNTAIRARRGRMNLLGSTVKEFFDVCVKEITASVDNQINGLNVPVRTHSSNVALPYPFPSTSCWWEDLETAHMFETNLKSDMSREALVSHLPMTLLADGALIWSTLSSVYSRAPRYSFGIHIAIPFLSNVHSRQGRSSYIDASGEAMVSGAWSQIVQKGVALDSEVVCRSPYVQHHSTGTPDLELFTVNLIAYSGEGTPEWVHSPNGSSTNQLAACTIKANLKNLEGALTSATGRHGSRYWSLNFDVCIRFGGTELESYLEWNEHVSVCISRLDVDN
ncbi:hypothetical protein AG1IA_08982 [Rhizoctonia solani AG-1 IA]|uniref:Heat shock 70 kDa protein 12A n=1 Tax=Thanatephorus cucumeris (strain AG1-IA) TaxID=983506 RepID=L8WG88_THACA|nr:hypothetical protein AG1IA_08982 [Rhizoctonia solani AG-1 IA]